MRKSIRVLLIIYSIAVILGPIFYLIYADLPENVRISVLVIYLAILMLVGITFYLIKKNIISESFVKGEVMTLLGILMIISTFIRACQEFNTK